MDKRDGMNYAPEGIPAPVVNPGEFVFAAIGLDHGHIYGMRMLVSGVLSSCDTCETNPVFRAESRNSRRISR